MKLARFYLGAACLSAAALAAVPASAREASFSVSSGVETLIEYALAWDASCNAIRDVVVSFSLYPGHGQFRVLNGRTEITADMEGGPASCVGTSIRGQRIMYFPDQNFHGVDAMRWNVTTPDGTRREVRATITVN